MQDPNPPFDTTEAQPQTLLAQFQQQGSLGSPDKKISRHKFSSEEDELLRELVGQDAATDWGLISRNFPSRTVRQCRDRWRHYLNPQVIIGNWTEAEEQLLVQKVNELGKTWSVIAKSFPGRTDIGIKNHYIAIMGRKSKEAGSKPGLMLPLTQAGEDQKFGFELQQHQQGGDVAANA
jgi:hypothetical protein